MRHVAARKTRGGRRRIGAPGMSGFANAKKFSAGVQAHRACGTSESAQRAGVPGTLPAQTRCQWLTLKMRNMASPSPAVIFDVEGTLVDCVPQTLECWRRTLAQFGHSFSRDELWPYSGMDGEQMLATLLPELPRERMKEILTQQDKRYEQHFLQGVQLFPHVRETCEALKEKGFTLGIATTCKHEELAIYDKQLQVLELADAIVCGDDAKHGKPRPDLFRIALRKLKITATPRVFAIGDTPYDSKAATALGLQSVGVLTGGFSQQELHTAGCNSVLEQVGHVTQHLAGA